MNSSNFRIAVFGAFAFKTMDTGGQPVKTRELYYALQEIYGIDSVRVLDTAEWKKNPIKCFLQAVQLCLWCNRCIMLPAENGLKLFSRMLCVFKNSKRKIYYDVIGGWIANYLKSDVRIMEYLRRFDGIWVETQTTKEELVNLGLSNVYILRNFKNLDINMDLKRYNTAARPYKICTFSRVVEDKGIGEAIKAVSRVNVENKDLMFILDIYGPIDPKYENTFRNLIDNNRYVNYKGIVSPTDSVKVLKDYMLLLFPTKFYTEGIPGTIIDAYAAGIPVIASKWRSWADVIINNKSGIVYTFNDTDELISILNAVAKTPEMIGTMKEYCVIEAQKYTKETAIRTIENLLR